MVNAKNISTNSPTNPQGLPHYPIPKLQDTLAKFLTSVEPHVSAEKFENTKNVVKQFADNEGQKLQALLEKRAGERENWLSDWWLQSAYLTYRDPVIVFSSPGLVFPQRKFTTMEDKAKFSAKVVSAALSYKKMIDTKQIPMEKMGKFELDMAQYDKIFGTCRIPGIQGDSLTFNPNSTHIAIVVNNKFFKVPVMGSNGQILSEDQILGQIKSCIERSKGKIANKAIGILTSDNRDNWAEAMR